MPGSPVADIRTSFGAAFVGLLVSTTLYGLTIVQTWSYFWHYRNRDPKALKFFIVFLLCVVSLVLQLVEVAMFVFIRVMDTSNTILCAYAIYWYLVLNFGNIESLDYIMWAINIQIPVGAFVGASVQLRVYIVSQSIICPILIVTLVAIAFSFGISFIIKEFAIKRFSRLCAFIWNPCVAMVAITLADVLIAAAMCWSLYRKRTGFAKQARPFDIYAVDLADVHAQNGFYNHDLDDLQYQYGFADEYRWDHQRKKFWSQSFPCEIFLFDDQLMVSPSMIWVAFLWTMGKCSVNSLLAMLNSRDYILERSEADDPDNAINLSSIRFEQQSEAHGSKSKQTGISVTVHQSTASNFTRSKYDPNVGPTFEVPKPV
ncbi:hypothetical protein BJY52DRAFT_1193446 [Lactarius psammicola]|nr:hypothetical protein BJY52DRAFT_1193446 [Lactarius psammicola]